MRSRFGYAVASLCLSGFGAATAVLIGSREKNATLTRDNASSESGLGPAWTRPSQHIESSEIGAAAARLSPAARYPTDD
jgi:hypothetical protein